MIAVKTYKKQERVDYKSLIVVNKATQNYDPTRTTVLRAQFMKDMDRRFVSLGCLIKQAIIEDDVFGLIEPKHSLVKIINVNADTPGKEAFKFATSQDKVSQFMKWLKEQERKGLINTTTINTSGTPIEKAWTDQYIADSYKRGVTRARYEMGAAGMGTPGIEETGGISASMSTPFHMDRVGMLYARTFEDLKGITAVMDSAISRILSQGMVDGDGPRSLAGKIVDATGVSRRRAMTLARTEIIRAHHSAMVQEYKNWAVEGVVVKAEWVTAGFNVCKQCEDLEKGGDNGVYSLNEIEGMIPAHPNCRCMALPTMPEKGVKKVEKIQEKVLQLEPPVVSSPLTEMEYELLKTSQYSDFIHDTSTLKNKITDTMGLNQYETNLLNSYTDDLFQILNADLREGKPGLPQMIKGKLNQALTNLPKTEGTVYRNLNVKNVDGFIQSMQGDSFRFDDFVSTTRNKSVLDSFGGNVHLEILSKNGRDISKLAVTPEEQETLFQAGSHFKFISSKVEGKATTINLVEL